MEIEVNESAPRFELRLKGRLDASWSPQLSTRLASCLKDGRHDIGLDLSEVTYISSAGIRVLVDFYKQLHAVSGVFGISAASEQVRAVLSQAGLFKVLFLSAAATDDAAQGPRKELVFDDRGFKSELFALGPGGFRVERIGAPDAFRAGQGARLEISFPAGTIGLGLGAFAEGSDSPPPGEFLAAEGMAVCQPADGAKQADYLLSQENLIPTLSVAYALKAEGQFTHLLRFETSGREHAVPLSRLSEHLLQALSCNEAVCVVAAEIRALVGAALVKAPGAELFEYPSIKDHITFTSEPAYRDTLTVAVGVVKRREASKDDAFLRPLSKAGNLLGHFHGIVFPFTPLPKGKMELRPLLSSLFENYPSLALLHLLHDWRDASGAGESDFLRGAMWGAPVTNTVQGSTPP